MVEDHERAAGTAASRVAPRVGFEPTTLRLTAGRSTIELPRNGQASLFYPLPLSANKRMATSRARLEDRTYNPRGRNILTITIRRPRANTHFPALSHACWTARY